VRKVRVLIREAGRTGEVEEEVIPTTAYEPDPRITAANPSGRIPVLIRADGPALADSRVITRFLDDRWATGLYPKARLWEVLTLEAMADGIADSSVAMAYEVRMRPEERQHGPWLEAHWAKVTRSLDAIEDRWASHLAGPVDMGQLALACALGHVDLRHGARGWREGRPQVAAFVARLGERPSFRDTAPPPA
jgi:glutathione S-transferase